MNTPRARAYIAPENHDEPIRYSGYVERPDGVFEFSPTFGTLLNAVDWARERTDFVVARDVADDYRWYGVGPQPPDIELPQ